MCCISLQSEKRLHYWKLCRSSLAACVMQGNNCRRKEQKISVKRPDTENGGYDGNIDSRYLRGKREEVFGN